VEPGENDEIFPLIHIVSAMDQNTGFGDFLSQRYKVTEPFKEGVVYRSS
jgi:hypothetical protein